MFGLEAHRKPILDSSAELFFFFFFDISLVLRIQNVNYIEINLLTLVYSSETVLASSVFLTKFQISVD